MVNYKLIRAAINEAEFLSHGSSEAQVDAGQSLTPFFFHPEALPNADGHAHQVTSDCH